MKFSPYRRIVVFLGRPQDREAEWGPRRPLLRLPGGDLLHEMSGGDHEHGAIWRLKVRPGDAHMVRTTAGIEIYS